MKVLTVGGDGDGCLNHAAETVGKSGSFVVEPVGVCSEDPVDMSEEREMGGDRGGEATGASFFFAFDEEDDVAAELAGLVEFSGGEEGCEKGAFVVGDAASVEVAV